MSQLTRQRRRDRRKIERENLKAEAQRSKPEAIHRERKINNWEGWNTLLSEEIDFISVFPSRILEYDRFIYTLIKAAERHLNRKKKGTDAIFALNSHDLIRLKIKIRSLVSEHQITGQLLRELFITALVVKWLHYETPYIAFLGYPKKTKSYDTWLSVIDIQTRLSSHKAFQVKEGGNWTDVKELLENIKKGKLTRSKFQSYEEPVIVYLREKGDLNNPNFIAEVATREHQTFIVWEKDDHSYEIIWWPEIKVGNVGITRSGMTLFIFSRIIGLADRIDDLKRLCKLLLRRHKSKEAAAS